MPTASSSCPQFLTPEGRDSGTEARKHAEMMARNLKMDTRGNELPSPHETWTWAPPSPHSPVCPPLAAPAAVASSPSCNSPDTTSGHLQWRFPPPRRFALGHPQGLLQVLTQIFAFSGGLSQATLSNLAPCTTPSWPLAPFCKSFLSLTFTSI